MAGYLPDNVCVFANLVHSVLFVVFLHGVWHPFAPSNSQIGKRPQYFHTLYRPNWNRFQVINSLKDLMEQRKNVPDTFNPAS